MDMCSFRDIHFWNVFKHFIIKPGKSFLKIKLVFDEWPTMIF